MRYKSRRAVGWEITRSRSCRWSSLLRYSNDFDGHGGVGKGDNGGGGTVGLEILLVCTRRFTVRYR